MTHSFPTRRSSDLDKRYITLAPVATIIGLAFCLYDPDGLIGDTNDIGITIALVPRDTDGVDIGRRHFPLNSPFQNGPIHGRSEEHTSELQSLMRISYAVFCLKKKKKNSQNT